MTFSLKLKQFLPSCLLLVIPTLASASSNYPSTNSNNYWNQRGGYQTSLTTKGQSGSYGGRFGPPPLGPQIPDPLPLTAAESGGFRPVGYSATDNSYINQLPVDRPSCARKRDYCLHDHDYPMDMVRSIVQRYQSDIYRMYTDMQPLPLDAMNNGNNVSYRYNFPSERGTWACETDIFTMRIGWARNWAGRWKVVLNTEQFPQSVRLEHCKYENRTCQMMPPCVRSSCLQRYTAVQLLSTDPQTPDRTPTVDTFLLPGGCSCYIDYH